MRASAYVDGFNLFHGITERTKTRGCRWLNLRSLLQSELLPGHTLEKVIFFTSIPPWNNGKKERHETYIAALETEGVEVVRGRFQQDLQECYGQCGQQFKIFTEKHTDVNIATRMVADAVLGRMEWAYLVSGDADQTPTIRTVRLLVWSRHNKTCWKIATQPLPETAQNPIAITDTR